MWVNAFAAAETFAALMVFVSLLAVLFTVFFYLFGVAKRAFFVFKGFDSV